MTQIVATPTELFSIARSHKPAILIVLPHAYEACHTLRKIGVQYRFLRAAPSIAGKIALISIGDAIESEKDFSDFELLSPVCGMKDGRIVNTTGHVLPFEDEEPNRSTPTIPVDEKVGDYILQRVDNEWYYYMSVGTLEQEAVLDYIHGLALLASTLKSEISE